MARTLSVFDDDTNVTASMTVDAGHRITELRFIATNGASITAADLGLVAEFGLTLPALSAPKSDPAPSVVVNNHSPAAPKPNGKRKRRAPQSTAPSDEKLLRLWIDCNGNKSAMAAASGKHPTTIYAWLKAACERGQIFPAVTK